MGKSDFFLSTFRRTAKRQARVLITFDQSSLDVEYFHDFIRKCFIMVHMVEVSSVVIVRSGETDDHLL